METWISSYVMLSPGGSTGAVRAGGWEGAARTVTGRRGKTATNRVSEDNH